MNMTSRTALMSLLGSLQSSQKLGYCFCFLKVDVAILPAALCSRFVFLGSPHGPTVSPTPTPGYQHPPDEGGGGVPGCRW